MESAVANTDKVAKPDIPEVFIAEYLDGIPMYYKGYKSILNTPSQIESIMGAGGIHSIILEFIYSLLIENLDKKKYWRYTGETGLKMEKENLFNLDIAVYLREKLPAQSISKSLLTIAPELVVAIDTAVEFDTVTEDEYVFKKTQRLLQFGTQKVIWVFSRTNMVMVAQPGSPWQLHPWSTTLELMNGITFNIEAYCLENELNHLLNQ